MTHIPRGIVVLGLDASADELRASFELAARHDLVKGFAVGRTIFGDTARAYMQGKIAPEDAIAEMAQKYQDLCSVWDQARKSAQDHRA